jgi:phosphopantothenoylcysteine decarboxylase/phosphopantothenate--cysteine ligase
MKVILGVSASVAIYKAVELARLLVREDAEVTVVMTPNAAKLVDPRLFDAVTGRPALTDLFAREHAFAHLDAAEAANCFAVVPATANVLAKLSAGLADDALTTVALAVDCARLVAPAMNPKMWAKAEVQRNVSSLRELDYAVVPPAEGPTACGDEGLGKLADVNVIAEDILRSAYDKVRWDGKRLVVTAGPTRERFDAVRVLTNPSSGIMGYEVARRAARRGATVTLVSGVRDNPVPLANAVKVVRVESAAEMYDATSSEFEKADALVMAAAVADYSFNKTEEHKAKKSSKKITMSLIPTKDIITELAKNKGDRVVVGFAAETDNLVENAKDKLLKKGVDFIVANVVGSDEVGFGSDSAEAVIVSKEKVEHIGKVPKARLADKILDEIEMIWGLG